MTNKPPPVYLSDKPYSNSFDHLQDELARVDLLVRAQIVRWRMTIAETKAPEFWGMLHVTDAEISRYLAAPIAPPDHLPSEIVEVVNIFREAEKETRRRIDELVLQTPSEVDLIVERLRAKFSLSDVELDSVLLSLLPEVDDRYARIFGYVQDDASKVRLPVVLLSQMLFAKAGSIRAALALFQPNETLLRNHLIAVDDDVGKGSMRRIRIDEGLASILLGSSEIDPRLGEVMSQTFHNAGWVDLFVDAELSSSLQDFAEHANELPGAVIFHGPSGSGRQKAAKAISAQRGQRLFIFDVERALRNSQQWDLLVNLAFRDARLLGASIYFCGVERLYEDKRESVRWNQLVDLTWASQSTIFLGVTESPETSSAVRESPLLRFEFVVPHYEMRKAIWMSVLRDVVVDGAAENVSAALAASFQITEGQIRESVDTALKTARRRSFSNPQITRDDLFEACRVQAGRRLLGFARRIEPTRKLTLNDVILSDANKTQLRELLNRVSLRSRLREEMGFEEKIALSRGLVALFAGPSGVGKTLSAELIANQQGVDLYKVDLSAVVSKWLGETEQNLRRIFDEAEDSDALLFFDECESLFGQRGETSSEASGRWANLQVNYLLQRIEEHPGVVILATNLRKNIDEAFLRRIQVIIEFATPDAAMRFEIWKRTLPATTTDISDDELRTVAERFALTGGSMRNSSIDAAFRALSAGRENIVLRDLLDAVAREYQKVGKPITLGEFGAEYYSWVLRDILDPQPSPAP